MCVCECASEREERREKRERERKAGGRVEECDHGASTYMKAQVKTEQVKM